MMQQQPQQQQQHPQQIGQQQMNPSYMLMSTPSPMLDHSLQHQQQHLVQPTPQSATSSADLNQLGSLDWVLTL